MASSAPVASGASVASGFSRTSPHVQADFKIDQGGFRKFKYDTFGGTVNYRDRGIDVDARLQQNPTTWIEAKGYMPMAAFKSGTNAGNEHRETAAREDQFDLHIDEGTFTTVGGYVLGRIGRRVRVGDTVEIGGRTMRVIGLDGLRVAKVWLSKPVKRSGSGAEGARG